MATVARKDFLLESGLSIRGGWSLGVRGGDGSGGTEGETAKKNNENSAIILLVLKLMDDDAINTAGSSTEQEG